MQDNQTLAGAKYSPSGYPISTYDDGFGPLWISRNSIGITGIVRARTFQDAYEICEDEFFPEADETIEQLSKEYGFERKHVKVVNDHGTERDDSPDDYIPGGFKDGITFVRWETRETPNPNAWSENELFQEAFGFRPNGPNATDKLNHGIYSKDLNGDYLDPLTPELIDQLNIELEITTEE